MRMLCTECGQELKCLRAGVLVKELFRKNREVYRIWSADLLECPECDLRVVARFADKPLADHFDPCDKTPMAVVLKECEGKTLGFDLFIWKEYARKAGDYLPEFLRRKERTPMLKNPPGPEFETAPQGDPRKE